MNKTVGLVCFYVLSAMMVLVFGACSKDNGTTASTAAMSGAKAMDSADSVTVLGSTALQPLAEKASQMYMASNPDAKISVQGGGSGTGLTQVFQGGATIGNSDIFAEEKLQPADAQTLVDHKVCVVGFAAVVNPHVSVSNLSQQQIIDIFTGKIKNWKEVGGNNLPIVIVNRPKSSGTRATFKRYALKGADEAEGMALQEDSSGTVKQTVAQTEGSISYLALSYLNDQTVKVLSIDGVAPTADNIMAGKYPIWSYEHMYTKGEPTGLAKTFLEYMQSDAVQNDVVKAMNFIPVSAMKVTR